MAASSETHQLKLKEPRNSGIPSIPTSGSLAGGHHPSYRSRRATNEATADPDWRVVATNEASTAGGSPFFLFQLIVFFQK
ncbi:hypothetical protein CRG98_004502 [Punica granatum]|uniref:Uncharacterized protein n=1 Tax=Punica granatum TaxID=22663 RepID=A0A2I0L387_PUNGR|nr:hypothetical protein CRG98_004502 [Punica granatum]